MKVAHLTYDMRIGGTEKVIMNLLSQNTHSDLEQQVLCLELPIGPFGESLQQSGVKVTGWHRRDGVDWSLILTLRNYIKREQIDILHCHQYSPWSYGALACIGLSTRVLFTEHGRFYPDFSSPKRKWVNPVLEKLTAKITAISQATKQALVDYEFLTCNRIQVIYNGLTPSDSSNVSTDALNLINDQSMVFGTIARFDPIKNHPLMISAFAELHKQHPNSTLLLVGDGETRAELEALVQKLGIQDAVIFTGYHPSPELLCQRIDVFLLTSFSEGTSMTLIDALRLKKPAIVTNVGGNPEIIRHGHNGFVVESGDQAQLVVAMQKLLDPLLREDMGAQGYATYTERFTAKKMQDDYHHLYCEVLS